MMYLCYIFVLGTLIGFGMTNPPVSLENSFASGTNTNNNIVPKISNLEATNGIPQFSVGDPTQSAQEQYRASYYFGGHPQHQFIGGNPDWNRDTYVNAASDLANQADSSQQYQYGAPAAMYGAPSSSYGVDDGYDSDGGAGGGLLGGLGGLAALLGLKGLKGAGILGLLKLGIIPLLVLIIPLLLLLPLLLLFVPIPVITIPTGRSFGIDIKDLSGRMSNLAKNVLESDKCIERLSCEMSRYSRGTFIDKTFKRVINKYEIQMPNPLQRMARAYMEPSLGCKKFNCFLLDDVTANIKKSKKSS